MFQTWWPVLVELSGFEKAWITFLLSLKTCACNTSSEVSQGCTLADVIECDVLILYTCLYTVTLVLVETCVCYNRTCS